MAMINLSLNGIGQLLKSLLLVLVTFTILLLIIFGIEAIYRTRSPMPNAYRIMREKGIEAAREYLNVIHQRQMKELREYHEDLELRKSGLTRHRTLVFPRQFED